ncbi:MAG: hypothetical protein V4532_15680 [Pseudomonadota bacterium]
MKTQSQSAPLRTVVAPPVMAKAPVSASAPASQGQQVSGPVMSGWDRALLKDVKR